MAQQTPSIGRMVHYVLEFGPHKGEHRPACIVRIWSDDMVNLQVSTDGENDYDANDTSPTKGANVLWKTSIHRDDSCTPGTWHWPEFIPAIK